MDSARFLIEILVKARNELGGAMQKAAADVDRLTGAQDRQAKSAQKLGRDAEDARRRFDEFTKSMKNQEHQADATVAELRKFGNEFDRLSRKAPTGSVLSQELTKSALAARRAAAEINEAERAKTEVVKREAAKRTKELEAEAKAAERQAAAEVRSAERAAAAKVRAEEKATAAREREAAAQTRAAEKQAAAEARAAEKEAATRAREAEKAAAAETRAAEKAAAAQAKAEASRRATILNAASAAQAARDKESRANRALKTSIEDVEARYSLFNTEVDRGVHSSQRASAGYRQFANEFGTLQRKFEAGSADALRLGEHMEQARGRSQAFASEMRKAGSSADRLHNSLLRLFGVDDAKIQRITGRIDEFNRSANKSRFSVAALDNRLRGLIVVGAIAFFQQLIGVVAALGGTLVALASAAVQAGAALAGMAVSGAAQALPVVGLLAAAWGRVGAVFRAVQQAQKAQAQSSFDNAQAANRSRASARALEQAQQGVADAHRRATEAQQALTKARADGVRQIQDLIAAERQAELQQKQALQSQLDAQRSLRQDIRTGNIDQQASDELNLQSANQGVDSANLQLSRARQDAGRARRGGVEGLDSVIAARKAVEDAQRGIKQAQQGLQDARDQASETVRNIATGQRLLDQMISQFSPAEKRLYQMVTRVYATWRKLWQAGILNPIIDSFTVGAKRIDGLLRDPRILAAAATLSLGIGKEINKFTRYLSSDRVVAFIQRMATEANRNLPIIGRLFRMFADIFQNIAVAAAPALHQFLIFIQGLVREADRSTSTSGGISKLQHFFSQGEKYAEGFIRLGIAISRLFLAIIGASAKQGGDALTSATRDINKAADWITRHRKDVSGFIHEARQSTGYILRALGQVAVALFSLFNPGQVKVFADAFTKFVLPALVDVFTILGKITKVILEVFDTSTGSAIMQFLLTTLLLTKTISPIITLFSRLIVVLGTLFSSEKLVAAGFTFIEIASGPIGVALAGLAALIFLLRDRFHNLGDVLTTLGEILGGVAAVGLVGKLLSLTGVFGGVLSKVTGLISKLPILNRLLKTTAETEAVTSLTPSFGGLGAKGAEGAAVKEGEAAVEAGAGKTGKVAELEKFAKSFGSRFGGTFTDVAGGLIKKAGWIGLGISAVGGIISGFKHHSVAAGFQDFFHSVSFGLIKSVDEAGKEAAVRLSARLKHAIPRIIPRAPRGGEPTGPGAGAPPISLDDLFGRQTHPTTLGERSSLIPVARQGLTKAGQDVQALIRQYGDRFKSFMGGLRDELNQLRTAISTGDAAAVPLILDQIRDMERLAPPKFKSALEALIAEAEHANKRLQKAFDLREAASNLGISFGLALQKPKADVEKTTQDMIASLKKLPPGARKQAAETAIQMAQGLAEKGVITKKQADKIRDEVTTSMQQMHNRSVKATAKLAVDTATVMGAIVNVVSVMLGDMSGKVSSVLKSLGFKGIKTPADVSHDAKNAGALLAGLLGNVGGDSGGGGGDRGPQFRATGGFVGQQGERGPDAVPTVLGRGEAVLNWAHQSLVEPAMRAMYGFGLGGLFDRVKGVHGTPAEGGFARGRRPGGGGYGFTALPGTNFSVGQEPKIAAALDRMGQTMRWLVYGISGYRSPSYSVSVGGFPNDPHTRGQAADIGINSALRSSASILTAGILKRFGLYRPFYPQSASEINHVQLLAGASRQLRAATADVTAAVKHLKMPHIPGSGPLHDVVQGYLKKVVTAGNKRIDQQGGKSDLGGNFTGGGSAQANVGLAKKMAQQIYGWVGAQWGALKSLWSRESGFRTNADTRVTGLDPPGASVYAYGIPQARPAEKMAKYGRDWRTNPVPQIKWGLNYIKGRYGDPLGAMAHENAYNWYAKGGQVLGRVGQAVGAVLHGNEHVWTADEVSKAGGHQVMYALRKALGGGGQGHGSYAVGGRVLEIGDSLGVGIQRYLDNAIKHLTANNQTGRTSGQAVDILHDRISKAYKKVILDVGSNDATAGAFAKSLRRAINLVGDSRELILSKLHGGYQVAAKNRVLERFAARHDNVTVVDPRGQLGPDHLHYTPQGYRTAARAFTSAVRDRSGGGSGSYVPQDVNPLPGPLLAEIRRGLARIRRMGLPTSGSSNFVKSLREVIGQDGLIDQLETAIGNYTTRIQTALTNATFKVTRSGKIIKRLSDQQIANRTAANLAKVYKDLAGERGVLSHSLKDINDKIAEAHHSIEVTRAEGKHVSAAQKKALALLKGYRRNVQQRLDQVAANIADNIQQQYDAVESALQTHADAIQKRADARIAKLDLQQRFRDLVGGTILGATGAPSNTDLGQQRADSLNTQADTLKKLARQAKREGHGDLAKQLLQQVQDLRLQAAEALEQGIAADADEITRQFERRNQTLDLKSQIAQALGRTGDVASIAVQQIQSMKDQIKFLTLAQKNAAAHGFGALAEQIGDQITQLQGSIFQAVIQQLHDAVDAVDAAAQRQSARLDLQDRVAQLMDSAGNKAGAFALRGQTLQSRGQNIMLQIGALMPLLARAQATGDTGEVNTLTAEIADLNVQLQENAAAIKENTVQARQAQIDAITNRSGFLTGVFGGLGNLVTAVAAVTGTLDTATQSKLIAQTISTLQGTGASLASQLFEAFGIDLRGSTPTQLVNILSGLNYDGIEASFSDSQRQQFESLISAIIDNATAVQQNTDQLHQITDPTTQTWTTTAWQWFRQAIFNGAGGLLPQYQVPALENGGAIISSGMAYVHAGEVVAANVDRNVGVGGSSPTFAPTIVNEERVVDMDADTLANRLLWGFKERPTG